MRVQLRIVAGSLRGRKLNCSVNKGLRPAPQTVREALFSILGDAVPDRPFIDLFAGTGAVGLEALSRGARSVVLVERDFRTAAEIDHHLREFGVDAQATVHKTDAYRWTEHWGGAGEPVNVFVGPPYPDFERRFGDLLLLVADLQSKLAAGSVLIVQAEEKAFAEKLPRLEEWETRRYGRNMLLLWVKHVEELAEGAIERG